MQPLIIGVSVCERAVQQLASTDVHADESYVNKAPGHIAADCTNKKACNNCRKTGHLARDCPNDPVGNLLSEKKINGIWCKNLDIFMKYFHKGK